MVLNALLVLISKPPPVQDRRMLVICTTSDRKLLQSLGFRNSFMQVSICIPCAALAGHFLPLALVLLVGRPQNFVDPLSLIASVIVAFFF